MKLLKLNVFLLAAGLFFASCGEATEENTNMEDTMQMEPAPAMDEQPEAMPDTVNGIDTTVNLQEKATSGVGPANARIGG